MDYKEIKDMHVTAFNEVMSTNALAPLKVVEALQSLVADDGTIAVMSSNQGSQPRNAGNPGRSTGNGRAGAAMISARR